MLFETKLESDLNLWSCLVFPGLRIPIKLCCFSPQHLVASTSNQLIGEGMEIDGEDSFLRAVPNIFGVLDNHERQKIEQLLPNTEPSPNLLLLEIPIWGIADINNRYVGRVERWIRDNICAGSGSLPLVNHYVRGIL